MKVNETINTIGEIEVSQIAEFIIGFMGFLALTTFLINLFIWLKIRKNL